MGKARCQNADSGMALTGWASKLLLFWRKYARCGETGSEIGFLRCIDKSVRGKPTPYIKYEYLVRFYNSKESGFNRKS